MNFSVESEGIDFILRFRDLASDQISIAEKAYSKLVSAMQSLISTEKAFADATSETMNMVAKQLQNNPYPLITPLTISPDQLGLMAQFENQAVLWFQRVSSQLLIYIQRVRRATIITDGLRVAISKVLTDFKEYGKSLSSLGPILANFSQMKMPTFLSPGLKAMFRDLQGIVRIILEWAKVSPDFRKAAHLNEEQVTRLAHSMDEYQKTSQKANFHTKDLGLSMKQAGKDSEDLNPKLRKNTATISSLIDQLAGMRQAFGGVFASIAFSQSAQKFASLEDVAFSIRMRVGEAAGSTEKLIQQFRELGRDAKLSAQEVAGAFYEIAVRSGHVNEATGRLAVLATEFAKVTGTSSDFAGQIAGDMVKTLELSESTVGELMKMAFTAQKAAKGLTGADILQFFIQNQELFRRTAIATGQSLDQVVKNMAASLMTIQVAFSKVAASPDEAAKMLDAFTNVLGKNAQEFRLMVNWSQSQYMDLVHLVEKNDLMGAFEMVVKGMKNLTDEHGNYTQEAIARLQAFEKATGISMERVQQWSRIQLEGARKTDAGLRNQEEVNKGFTKGVKEWHDTVNGMLNDLRVLWEFFQTVTAPILKKYIAPLLSTMASFAQIIAQNKTAAASVGWILTAFEVFMGAASVRWFIKFFGFGGFFRDILSLFRIGGGASAITTGLTGSAAAATTFGTAIAFAAKAVALLGAAYLGYQFGTWLREHIPLVREFGDAIGGAYYKALKFFHLTEESFLQDDTKKAAEGMYEALKQKRPGHKSLDIPRKEGESYEDWLKRMSEASNAAARSKWGSQAVAPEVQPTEPLAMIDRSDVNQDWNNHQRRTMDEIQRQLTPVPTVGADETAATPSAQVSPVILDQDQVVAEVRKMNVLLSRYLDKSSKDPSVMRPRFGVIAEAIG